MPLKQPESIDECIYYTQRTLGAGKVRTWVFKQQCPKCQKALMGKPVDAKGKIKIRAKEYVCSACKYNVEKQVYEESLICIIQYVCPACNYSGESHALYKRKKINGIPTLQTECEKCHAKINITKKMKAIGESDGE